MSRCGCDTSCSCILQEGANITIIGNGNPGSEYVISATAPPPPLSLDLAVFSRDNVLTAPYVGVGRFLFYFDATITGVVAAVNTAPTGAPIILDVNKNGVSIFPISVKPRILAGAFSTAFEYGPDTTNIAPGDYLTVDIAQVGSIVPGSDLTVFIRYSHTP